MSPRSLIDFSVEYISASAEFLREAREEQTLMDADVAHAEFARTLDERYSNIGAVKFEAAAVRAPLRIALPGRDRVAIDSILHELERGHFWAAIRHHHGVEKKPVSALHPINENSHPICLIERKWVVLG